MNRYRLMLVAAVALTVCLLTVLLWPASPVPPAVDAAPSEPPVASVPEPRPAPAQVAARTPTKPEAANGEARPATVVALEAGDVPPEPEVENPPPQENDAIAPELPQTPQWRLEKTTHIATLLGRDVERLEREREAAEARGDSRRSEQLDTLLRRNRERLKELREQVRELGEAVKAESLAE
jgi:hypothetical protein